MDEAGGLSVGEQVCDKVWDEVGDEVGDEVSASPQACLLREKCRHFPSGSGPRAVAAHRVNADITFDCSSP